MSLRSSYTRLTLPLTTLTVVGCSALFQPAEQAAGDGGSPNPSDAMVDGAAEDSAGVIMVEFRPAESCDDATEGMGGNVDPTLADLFLVSGSAVGIRFPDVNIPQGSEIDSAAIVFTPREAGAGPISITIGVDTVSQASSFCGDIPSLRTREGLRDLAAVWMPGSWPDSGQQQTTDLSELVQFMVDKGDWSGVDHIAFILKTAPDTGGGGTPPSRIAKAQDALQGGSPILRVTHHQ